MVSFLFKNDWDVHSLREMCLQNPRGIWTPFGRITTNPNCAVSEKLLELLMWTECVENEKGVCVISFCLSVLVTCALLIIDYLMEVI